MPLYDYECTCGKQFEVFTTVSNRNNIHCECGRKAKLLTTLHRPQIRFPEGIWDIGDKEIYHLKDNYEKRWQNIMGLLSRIDSHMLNT